MLRQKKQSVYKNKDLCINGRQLVVTVKAALKQSPLLCHTEAFTMIGPAHARSQETCTTLLAKQQNASAALTSSNKK
eukprot:scaffold254153_cov13-Tisochrysis_lutea.AAC.1